MNRSHVPMTVATTSKQSSGLFWKSFTKGNAISGRYSTSAKMAAQWAKADRTLREWETGSDETRPGPVRVGKEGLPLQSPVQLLTLDGVFLLELCVRCVHASVRQTAVRRVVLWQAQQGPPHEHPAARTHTLGSCYHTDTQS